MPLGLISSEQLDDYWSQNTRRRVFYSYPNGTAPLTGLLSLAESEHTPQPQFGWNEERWTQIQTTTVAGPTSNTVFYTVGTTTTAGTTFTPTAGTAYRMYVSDASNFQVDDVVTVHLLEITSTAQRINVNGRVIVKNTTGTDYLEIEVLATAIGAIVNNSATQTVGKYVIHSGSAYAEGSRSRTGRYKFPVELSNYTQIFKTPFEMTGTALKEPLKYDKTGAYQDQLKKNGIDHMAGMEWAFFFGDRRATTSVDEDTGETVSRRTTGGILWFLKQWEEGNVSNGGAFEYRPSGTDVTTQTDYTTYTDKRIIQLNGNTVTRTQLDAIEALPFERTNATEWCKLCLCGPGYYTKIASAYERSIQVTQLRESQFEGWNFELAWRQGPAGKIYYKTHPLFSNPVMRNSAFYLDLGYLGYRHVTDRDTDVMPMIQLPDADKRKDQYLTEAGLELRFPEAHMYVEGLGGVTLG